MFCITFSSFKPHTENDTNFDAVSSKCANTTPLSKEDKNVEFCMNVKFTTLGTL